MRPKTISTAVPTHLHERDCTVLPVDDTSTLALLFHLNSEPWFNTEAYEAEGYEARYKRMTPTAAHIVLPTIDLMSPLGELLSKRSSCRSYAAKALALETLAELLIGAYGAMRLVRLPAGLEMEARSVPSAGGLYPLELYVLCHSVEPLADGLYHYHVLDHALEPLRLNVDPIEVSEFLLAQPFLQNANAIVFLSAVFERTLHKYGARGYRYILFEAGHLAQNLCLLATERSLGTLCVGGFMDAKTNRFIGLDGVEEAAIYCVGIGYPEAADQIHHTGSDRSPSGR
jgi:SagB-type dehydrogenase family enzyme